MRIILSVFAVVALSLLAGCDGGGAKKDLLTVDFKEGQSLRYKFVSSRKIEVDWGSMKGKSGSSRREVNKSSESIEMIISYEPVKVERYGLTTIKAKCEKVKIKRRSKSHRSGSRKDAAKNFEGKSFTFTVGPTGKIEDYSQIAKLVRNVGKKAFRPNKKQGRIKEPDMIEDFIATQWFLWDSVSSIDKATEGVEIGQTWQSQLSVPNSMVLRKARDVTYRLDEIRQSEKGRLAVIHSDYSLAESMRRKWVWPYTGRFQMSGTFGFFRNYKFLGLQGEGEELFNMDTGRTEQYKQQYRIDIECVLPLSLGARPKITIKQSLTMQLLDD